MMSPPWIQAAGTTNTVGPGFKAAPIILLPIALKIAKSFSTDGRLLPPTLGPSGLPTPFAHSASRIAQGLLALLPRSILQWFCSQVLSLDDDTTESTIDSLKSKETLWQMLARRGGPLLDGSDPAAERLPSRKRHMSPQDRLLEPPPAVFPTMNKPEPVIMEWLDANLQGIFDGRDLLHVGRRIRAHRMADGDIPAICTALAPPSAANAAKKRRDALEFIIQRRPLKEHAD